MNAELLEVEVYETRQEMGAAAAGRIAAAIRQLIADRGRAVGLFASAPSQSDTLAALIREPGIDWSRVTAFHLDEYLGFDENHPQSFRRFLREHLLSRVPVGIFHGLGGEAADAGKECARYAALLRGNPPDFAVIGIGENGHLAFNDPAVCDFRDPLAVKVVELDEECRWQQVHDGAFASFEEVPKRALSLTVPQITSAGKIFVAVPGARKKAAVAAALHGPVVTTCPASILRTHPNACLFLDRDSAS
jgi:glucosamine-6-phosphate deaminase